MTALALEALSALIDATVRPHTELPESLTRAGSFKELTTDNYLHTVFCRKPGTLSRGYGTEEEKQFVNLDNFFDPQFDFDFRSGGDSSRCTRGGESYTRPWGWYRYALKVMNKYPDGNNWLGRDGWRSDSSPGEWPVSFHGTSIQGAVEIAKSYYKAGLGQVYGRGIYSTPHIREAECYARRQQFTSKTDGNKYEVMMQNRINPQKRKVTGNPDYWLIPVPEGTSPSEERRIVESSIRPYGILIKQV